MKNHSIKHRLLAGILFLTFLLGACKPEASATQSVETPLPSQPSAVAATATTAPTPTLQPRVLKVCTAAEPASLYPYDGQESPSKRTAYDLLFDRLMEVSLEGEESSLLIRPAALGDNAKIVPVKVGAGSLVVDAYGQIKVLEAGSKVRQALCSNDDCVISWDGSSELSLNQVVLELELKPDLKWSDGEALTAHDYLFSFQLMKDAKLPSDQLKIGLTQSLKALDERTLEWKSLPGVEWLSPEKALPLPMPAHQLEGQSAADLAANPLLKAEALSYGPYRIAAWEAGQVLKLEANPHYYRAAEGLPAIKKLQLRFIPSLEEALAELKAGNCEILDESYDFLSIPQADWAALEGGNDIHLVFGGQAIELVFGVRPAAYDENYQNALAARPDYFGDARTRQALSLIVAKADLNRAVYSQHLPASVLVPPAAIYGPEDDPAALLEQAGWKLLDGKRSAEAVSGVSDGTPFRVSLLTGESQADQQVAALIMTVFAQYGIEVVHTAMPAAQLYAPGPDGPLFGRNFEMALVSWQTGPTDRCMTYASAQIPSAATRWIGTNLAGFASESFDLACGANLYALEPSSNTNAGSRCVGLCSVYLQESPSAVALDRIGIWLSTKALGLEPYWSLSLVESLPAE